MRMGHGGAIRSDAGRGGLLLCKSQQTGPRRTCTDPGMAFRPHTGSLRAYTAGSEKISIPSRPTSASSSKCRLEDAAEEPDQPDVIRVHHKYSVRIRTAFSRAVRQQVRPAFLRFPTSACLPWPSWSRCSATSSRGLTAGAVKEWRNLHRRPGLEAWEIH